MPTGERPSPSGFTYIGLLILVALGAAALGVAGSRWQTTLQRERETELIFRGRQIAAAIASYRLAGGGEAAPWPKNWSDLLDDRRSPEPRHHLRRLWLDPFTGQADWRVIRDDDGGMRGVQSRAERPAVVTRDLASPDGAGRPAQVGDHLFLAPVVPAAPASAAYPPRPDAE